MAEPKKVKDAARAIDATDLLARARRQSLVRFLWQALGVLLLLAVAVGAFTCLNSILNYSAQTEVPSRREPAGPGPQGPNRWNP